ncbi:MAG: carboxypeptidase-like regulatory domain-containing protein, partial [Bryobacteraceae bacterium]
MRCLSVLLFAASAAFAQEYTASLSVTVTDPSDALVPKAHVVLTDNALQRVFEAETNAGGLASFASLQPGQYSLEITKAGFDNLRIPGITLAVRDQQRLSAKLKLSAGTTSVTVTAQPESVSTDASMGISVDQNYFENLPVNGR